MIIFDFDGTLVDLWPRYYTVFSDLLKIKNLDINEYKTIKQAVHKDSLVAAYFQTELPVDYFRRKAVLLEEIEYLKYDRLLLDPNEINAYLSAGSIILTKRRNPENFKKQIRNLGINGRYFVIVEGNKKEWIEKNFLPTEQIIIIGDSLSELEAARLPNVEAWMVGYGLNSHNDFEESHIPYQFYESPNELEEELKRRRHAV